MRPITKPLMLALVGLAILGAGCDRILPFGPATEDTEKPYLCSTQIYRTLAGGEELVEEWQFQAYPQDVAALAYCEEKIQHYIQFYKAPSFDWGYRNLVAAEILAEDAVDCSYPFPPPTYGAPLGVELRWNAPSPDQAYVYIAAVGADGTIRTCEPQVFNAYLDYAEDTGMADWSLGGEYQRGKRHLRFSNVSIELNTPFNLGEDVVVNKLYIQSIGTVIAEHTGGTDYTIYPGSAKFFFYAEGTSAGETTSTSFCFANDSSHGFRHYQGPPYPFFTFAVQLEEDILGYDMLVKVHLSKPIAPFSFNIHQPYVDLVDKAVPASPVDLSPDLVWDGDDNLAEYYWFENYEAEDEVFLGKGRDLLAVPLAAGDHEITLVAYDSYHAYNSDTMILTVPNAPPVAVDDSYTMDEDATLVVLPKGVLTNDTDPNGDDLRAITVTTTTHGSLSLGYDGSLTYVPQANWFGTDTFTYMANDFTLDSKVATVTITVRELTPQQETQSLIDLVKELMAAGVVSQDQGNGLLVKLYAELKKLDDANTTAACGLLGALINNLKAYIKDGTLTPSQAQPLLDKAHNLLAELGC